MSSPSAPSPLISGFGAAFGFGAGRLATFTAALATGLSANDTQVGVVRICMQVDDLDAELAAIRKRGIQVVTGPTTLHIKWDTTRFAFFKDPDENFIEFIEFKNGQ